MLTFVIQMKGVGGDKRVFSEIAEFVTFMKKIGFIPAKIVKVVIYRVKWIKKQIFR